MDPIFKEDIRVRLPAVSNNKLSVKSDLNPLRPEHGQGQSSAIHSLSVATTSLSPFPPLPSASSAPIKFLPSLPTPEQRKRLLTRNIRAIPPQLQNHHKTGFIRKDFRPEKGNKVQLHTPPPPLSKPSPLIVRGLMWKSLITDCKTPAREIISITITIAITQTCQQRPLSQILQGRQGTSIAVDHPSITLTWRNIRASRGLHPPLIPACLFTIHIQDGEHSKTRL